MSQYYITVWCPEYGKYGYLMGTTNIESYKQQLKNKYERFTIDKRG